MKLNTRLSSKQFVLILMVGVLLTILSLPLISAVSEDEIEYTFKISEAVELKRPCWKNGTYCSTTAQCNLTIFYPNSSLFVNVTETNQYIFHSTSFVTQTTGIYFAQRSCCDVDCGSETFYIRFNPGGVIAIFLLLVGLGIVFLAIGFALDEESIAFISSILFIGAGIYSMIYGISNLSNLYTRIISISSIGIGLIIMFFSAYHFINED